MRIAVTYEKGNIFQHFGHTKQFKLFDIEDNRISDTALLETGSSGHGALANLLSMAKVDALICGGIGGGAKTALAEKGIKLYAGVSGSVTAAVIALVSGHLSYSTEANCDHHDHDEGHSCGEHSCGDGGCGSCKGH